MIIKIHAPCEMLFIIYVSITLGVTLSINASDKLGSPSYCFKKISVGERLITYDVTRIIERNSVDGCEQECNIYKCTHFSFGTASDGNGTCELTTDREISRRHDPKYDLYQRTEECTEGKPTGYEEACYRRIISGKRLHERFIRHSLPCNSLEACQHQCSIEKHFDCQGFNIRLDSARVGRGICELSSVASAYLDPIRDFVFDPEFVYYERDYSNDTPNCGHFNQVPNVIPSHNPEENTIGYKPPSRGGPYYGGDSYGPWSTGYGTVDHGPWGSHGYGSGFYESNNPSRGPAPSFQPNTPFQPNYYGYPGWKPFPNQPYPGPKPFPDQSYPGGKPFPNQPYPEGKPFPDQSYPGGTPFPGQTYPGGKPFPDQSYPGGKPLPDQSYPGGKPFPDHPYPGGKPFPDKPYPSGKPLPDQTYPGGRPFPNQPYPGGKPLPGQSYPIGKPFPDQHTKGDYPGSKPVIPPYGQLPPSSRYPTGDRRYDKPNKSPTYIIIDADADRGSHGTNLQPYAPNLGYLPSRPPALPAPRPVPPPPRPVQPPPRPVPPPPQLPSPSRPFYGPPRYLPQGPQDKFYGDSHNTIGNEVCFQRAHPGYKLNPTSIRGMYDTPTVLDCEAMCTKSPFKCTGYSFRYSSSRSGVPNCLLTDFSTLNRETHLLPDRSCDVYFKMGTCLDSDRVGESECFLKVASNRKIAPDKTARRMSVSGMSECELACLNSKFFTCRSFTFRYGPGVIGEPLENCFLSDWPITALTHGDFIPASTYEVYERGSYGHGCELDFGPPHIGPMPPFTNYPNIPPMITHSKGPWNAGETWRHFTVSGWPCRLGTECQLNPEAGFWACEVEGGDRAQWDYCCRPKHSCGFSRGHQYPWCYVGEAGPDQWRPCSEFYYPEFDNRYPYKPVQSHNPHPVDSYGPPTDTKPWNFGQEEYGPPSSWPISYLYAEPPPNETYVWDPEEHHHHHFHYYEEPVLPENYHLGHEHVEDSPKIKFKPCGHKSPYPRAIIQKLDLKNVPKAGDPGEQVRMEEKPRQPKKAEPVDKVPDSEIVFGFSLKDRDKENVKNEIEFFPTTATFSGLSNLTEDFTSSKRDVTKNSNVTDVAVSNKKTKEVIKTVEKIIEESSTEGNSGAETEKNETLRKVETKHPGFVTLTELEKSNFDSNSWTHRPRPF